jgi:predicted dehydrogenase
MKALVVGGGMYVTGRGTDTYGTIIPALYEAQRTGMISEIVLATTNESSARQAHDRAAELAKKMGVTGVTSHYPVSGVSSTAYRDAIEASKPALAIVSVPDHLHAEVTIPILEQGIHCLLVKPMAPTVAEGKALIAAAKRNNVIGQIEFHKRLDESNLLLREQVLRGNLGELLYGIVEFSQKKKIPEDIFSTWANKTNIFQYLGVHYVDLIHYITGFEPKRVSAWGQKEYLRERGIDTWDAVQAVIEWRKPNNETFVSTIITNWIDPNETSAMSDQKINLVGTGGRYQADQKYRGIQIVRDGTGIEDASPYFCAHWRDRATDQIRYSGYGIKSIVQFITDVARVSAGTSDVASLDDDRPTFSSAIVSTAVLEAVATSLHSVGPVDVEF